MRRARVGGESEKELGLESERGKSERWRVRGRE